MTIESSSRRMFFTFRNNGKSGEHELAEATVERLDEHEPPVGAEADKQSWFGKVDDLASTLESLGFSPLDIEGVLSTLKVNKVATREVESNPEALSQAGFAMVGSRNR